MMKIGIIGMGNLGSAVACLAGNNGHAVTGWEFNAEVVADINGNRRNQRYLPGITFPATVTATTTLEQAFAGAELLFIALPSRFIGPVLASAATLAADARLVGIVNLAKGLDGATGRTAMQQLAGIFPQTALAMLAGPSLANEFARGVMTVVVAASRDRQLQQQIGTALNGSRFAVLHSDDVMGVELGGILKNIYALGLGIFAARTDAGLNFTGAYLTQAQAEIQRLGVSLGARPESFLLPSGIGDLIATALSEESHNRTMGRLIGAGLSLQQVKEKMQNLPEGYNTLQVALALAAKHNISLPLAALLQQVVEGEITPDGFYERFVGLLKGQTA